MTEKGKNIIHRRFHLHSAQKVDSIFVTASYRCSVYFFPFTLLEQNERRPSPQRSLTLGIETSEPEQIFEMVLQNLGVTAEIDLGLIEQLFRGY